MSTRIVRYRIPTSSVPGLAKWANYYGSSLEDQAVAVALDTTGNIVVVGYFRDDISVGGTLLDNVGGSDLFIAKYSALGVHQWSVRYGAGDSENPICVAMDSSNNIYVGGSFSGTGNFGGSNFTSAGSIEVDGFLAKYNSSGVHQWSVTFGGSNADNINSLAIDSAGNVIATGVFQGLSVEFKGVGNVGNTILSSKGGSQDTFLAKWSPAGALIRAQRFDNLSQDSGTKVLIDTLDTTNVDSILLCGFFQTQANFGGSTFNTTGGYLAKFKANGDHLWSRVCGPFSQTIPSNPARPSSMALDSDHNIILVGLFSFYTDLNSDGTTMSQSGFITGSAAQADSFMAKYSAADGSFIWAKPIKGTVFSGPTAVAADGNKNIIIAGSFLGKINWTSTQSITTDSANDQDGFLAKFDSAGNFIWSAQLDSPGTDTLRSLVIEPVSNSPIACGGFSANSATLGGQSLIGHGSTSDVVIAKFNA